MACHAMRDRERMGGREKKKIESEFWKKKWKYVSDQLLNGDTTRKQKRFLDFF
jgi:hypothetical protein